MKEKLIIFTLLFVFALNILAMDVYASGEGFSDLPKNHWSYEYVDKLRKLGVSSGIGDNKFGLGKTITRGEFVAFLCKLMDWELVDNPEENVPDNLDREAWYYPYINTAIKEGVITDIDKDFHPNKPIIREDMAIMIVNSLGYNNLGKKLNSQKSEFKDVKNNIGFINMAKNFGFINGVDKNNFKPENTAKREEVAAILVRMYDRLSNEIEYKNAFYAIRSYNQKEAIKDFDGISFGWARLELKNGELIVNKTSSNNNEYSQPSGYEEVLSLSENKDRLLMFAVSDEVAREILKDSSLREKAVNLMVENSKDFDGLVVDFEGLKGESLKNNLNDFLYLLREKIGSKKIYVAVHPKGRENQAYYDGYDYRTIGEVADKVILMAHDYNAKSLTEKEMAEGITETPLTPIEDIYSALVGITDENTGVKDKDKILLQISFGTAQWKTRGGKVINQKPYTGNYEQVIARMNKSVEMNYSKNYENPYIKFYDSEDDTENILWYEDQRSVEAKLDLAKLFDIKGLSIWRLGLIPDGSSDKYMDLIREIKNY